MTSPAARAKTYRAPKYPGLTSLNIATSMRYDACQSSGGHVKSGDTIVRYFPGGERSLPICAVCECPFGGPRIGWTTNPMGRAYTR